MTAVQIELSEFLRWLEPAAACVRPDAELDEWDVRRLLDARAFTFPAWPAPTRPKVQTRRTRP